MGTTSWQIGSHPSVGPVTVRIRDSASGAAETLNVTTTTKALYLYDNNSARDAMKLLEDALRTYVDQDLLNTEVFLTRDRKVRIEWYDNTPLPQTVRIEAWGGAGATDFQTLLGFDGSEISASYTSSVTADETSPYLWSANKIETPLLARKGKTGAPYHDTAVGMSGTRVVVSTTNNSGKINDYRWERVINSRYWSTAESWGEYFVWWDYVQRRFRKFKIWQDVNELDASTSAATIGTALGPYVYRWDGQSPLSFPFGRDIDFLEYLHTVEIPCVEVDEYT